MTKQVKVTIPESALDAATRAVERRNKQLEQKIAKLKDEAATVKVKQENVQKAWDLINSFVSELQSLGFGDYDL